MNLVFDKLCVCVWILANFDDFIHAHGSVSWILTNIYFAYNQLLDRTHSFIAGFIEL